MILDKKVLVGCSVFCGVLLLLYAVTITIIFLLQSHGANNRSGNQTTKCETYGCVQAAAQIVSYINESIDPCEDFYQFANGHYISEVIDDTGDWDSRSVYSTVSKLMNRRIGSLLKEPPHSDEWKPFELAKSFYRSCLSQSIFVNSENQQLIDVLHTLGGWPVVQGKSWLSRKFDLVELIRQVRDLGFKTDFLFELDIYFDLTNNTNRWLRISKGNYENNERNEIEYLQKMLDTPAYFVNSNDTKADKRIQMEMNRVFEFEKKLIEDNEQETDYHTERIDVISTAFVDIDEDNNENESYQITTIEELQQSYPYLNWLDYINAILPSKLQVTENELIVDWDPRFLKNLGKILESTSLRTLANYIIWRAIYSVYPMGTDEIDKERRDYCIDLTSKKFPIPVALLYSGKYFNETTRIAVVDLVEDIRYAFIDMLRSVTWMDNATRAKAIEKAENIVAHVGYPSRSIHGYEEIEEYYNDLAMEPDNFLHNSLQLNLFNNNQMFNSLRKLPNRSGWEAMDLKPNVANALYNQNDNTIQFPIAILHELFFSADRPRYINYASLGNTVGHEITHGFDSIGGPHDLHGNLVNWWNQETLNKFDEKSKCFVEQYSRYEDSTTQLKVDGARTLNENIADNGGVRAAYYAYQNWIRRNGPEELVPGIKYDQNQLFWISYAQAEGTVYGIDSLRELLTDVDSAHAPFQFRVNGVVSNIREFASDFKCPDGTKMSPEERCRIW